MPQAKSDVRFDRLVKLTLRYFSFRDRSRQEVINYLQRKTKSQSIINRVLVKIDQFNLINDQKFAQNWISSQQKKGKGPRTISFQLKRKGIASSVIQDSLAAIPQQKWIEIAHSTLAKKGILPCHQKNYQFKSKVYRLLYSRGFPSHLINNVIDDIDV